MKSDCKEILVVAIDFGTTFSGYAFSSIHDYETDPAKIHSNIKWTSGTHNYGSLKTPTLILLKYNDKMKKPEYHGFGYEAQDKYTTLMEEDEHEDYILVDRFKMKLYSESAVSKLHKDTTITIGKDHTIKAIELISVYLEFLKNHFWSTMAKSKKELKEEDIRWVLTVPAIWTDGAKQFMREAAVMAKIKSEKLTIVYEPEAAALCCVYLQDPSTKGKSILEAGTKCIVVDAGGGTVDYTVNEVTDTKQLVIKHGASGGPWGGTAVDDKFFEMFKEIFGEEVFSSFVQNHFDEFVHLYRDFEIKKRKIPEDQTVVTVKFPVSIAETYEKINGKSMRMMTFGKYSNKVRLVTDKMRIDPGVIRDFFREVVDNIVDHTGKLLREKECKGTTTLLLVGGFTASEILQKAMKKAFPKLKVIIPVDPELAVLKGAVLLGHNPNVIKTRVARYTYGIKTVVPFEKKVHPEIKKEKIGGIQMCKDKFHMHVQKGQTLHVGKSEPKQRYTPSEATQTSMIFEFYASSEETPTFVTDDGCSNIGKLTIDTPDISGGLNRGWYVQLSFGETEITAVAIEEKTGKSVSASFNFIG